MKMTELGEICEIISGSTPSRRINSYFEGDIDWFTPKDLSGLKSKFVYESPEKISETGFKSCSATLIPPMSLLFTSRAPIGHLAINKLECCTNQGFKSLVPKNKEVDIVFLYYIIQGSVPRIQQLGRGATFKELSKKDFSKFKIPLPPLPIQERIASILDDAAALRDKTEQLLTEYDELAQSLFLEMFGDSVINPKGWEEESLDNISNVRSSKRVFVKELVNSGVPFYRGKEIGELSENSKVKTDLFITNQHYHELKIASGIPKVGDLLMPSICPDGRIYRVPNEEPFYFKDGRVLWISINEEKVNSFYLQYFLKQLFIANYLNIASGTTFAELKIFALKKVVALLPPLDLQNQFAEKVQLIERQKEIVRQELKESEDLFQALLQQAFKGELVKVNNHERE